VLRSQAAPTKRDRDRDRDRDREKEKETDRQTDSHKESERDIRERDRARGRVSREVKVHVLHVLQVVTANVLQVKYVCVAASDCMCVAGSHCALKRRHVAQATGHNVQGPQKSRHRVSASYLLTTIYLSIHLSVCLSVYLSISDGSSSEMSRFRHRESPRQVDKCLVSRMKYIEYEQ
jgi:hypothetical protein